MQDLPLFYAPYIKDDGILPESEAAHCLRVLRASIGDQVLITDGRGMLYHARLSEVSKRHCRVEITNEQHLPKHWAGHITLALAPTKAMERMEWLLEKAVEIGVDRVILLRSKHSERKHINRERLMRIMLSAMKQSQKTVLPELVTDLNLTEALTLCASSRRMMLHCRQASEVVEPRHFPSQYYNNGEDVSLFIGPEGDFSIEEIHSAQQLGVHPTTLGDSRLRTETAALVALQWIHTLQLIKQE